MRKFDLRGFGMWTLVVVTALCLVLREEFPFSHFPMYSSFSNYTYYVYVSGADGKPVPVESITSVRTSKLKKIYQDKLDEIEEAVKDAGGDWRGTRALSVEERRDAGLYTLTWLRENCKAGAEDDLASHGALSFHHVGLALDEEEAEMAHIDEVVATLP